MSRYFHLLLLPALKFFITRYNQLSEQLILFSSILYLLMFQMISVNLEECPSVINES